MLSPHLKAAPSESSVGITFPPNTAQKLSLPNGLTIISEEMQLRFSSMQVDVFALLTEARQRIASLRAAIDAKREFFLAQSELQTAVNGGGSGGSSDNPTTTAAAAPAAGAH